MDGGGVWNEITRRKPSGANNQFAHGTQPNRTKPIRGRGNISTPNACTRRSDISNSIPNSKCANFQLRIFDHGPHPARCLLTARGTLFQIDVIEPGSEIGPIIVQPIYGALGFDASGTIFRSSSIALPIASMAV
jgi:hypothetical protein